MASVRIWALILAVLAAGVAGYLAAILTSSGIAAVNSTHAYTSTVTVTETVTKTVSTTTTVTVREGQAAGATMPGNMECLAQELRRECSSCHAPPRPEDLEVIPGPRRAPIVFDGKVLMVGDKLAVLLSPNGTIIHAVRLPLLCTVKPGDTVKGTGLLAMKLANDTRWVLVKTEECSVGTES